jgi:hypothetical protein
MRLVLSFIILSLGLVLVASVPVGAAEQPCAGLLTLQDVTRAAGPGFKLPPPPNSGPKLCWYTRRQLVGESYLEELVGLSLKEIPGGAAPKLVELSNAFKSGGAPVEAASGLGPGAFYLEDKKARSTGVIFGKGNQYLELTYKVGKQSDPKAALALAKLVYARL